MPTQIYTKPFKNRQEQIDLLKSRGLLFHNECKAIEILQYIQYYRLSGYLHHFKDNNDSNGNFVSGVYFEDIIKLYGFDKKLRLLLLDAIETIEVALKSDIAYIIAEEDIFSHKNIGIYKNRKKYEDTTDKINIKWDDSKDIFTKHYKARYNSPPVWVIVEVLTFGVLVQFLTSLKPNKIIPLVRYFSIDIKTFLNWIRRLKRIRNICAHHGRIWNDSNEKHKVDFSFSTPPLLKSESTKTNEISFSNMDSRLYAHCLVIWHMLKIINPKSEWNIRLIELIKNDFPKGVPFATLEHMGFCEDWDNNQFWE